MPVTEHEGIGQPPAQVETALAYVPPDAYLDLGDIRRQVANWQDADLTSKDLRADEVIDTSFS